MNAGLMSGARSRALKLSSAALAVGLAMAAAGFLTSPACGQPIGDWNPPKGAWEQEEPAENVIHLPDGRILFWGDDPNKAKTWHPNGTFRPAATLLVRGCSGHTGLADGSVLVAGGQGPGDTAAKEAAIFHYTTIQWTPTGELNNGRFYPTLTMLADGRVLVTGGDDRGDPDELPVEPPEIWDPGTGNWTEVSVPTNPGPPFPPPNVFPFMFLTTTGTVFYAGSHPNTSLETWQLDLSVPQWFSVAFNTDVRGRPASAVMFSPGRVLKCGGFDFNPNGPTRRECRCR